MEVGGGILEGGIHHILPRRDQGRSRSDDECNGPLYASGVMFRIFNFGDDSQAAEKTSSFGFGDLDSICRMAETCLGLDIKTRLLR